MRETKTIDEFCMKLNGLVTNIHTLGETVEKNYVVKKIMRAAPAKFMHITSAIEQFEKLDEMTIEETVGSLKAHEERLRGQPENNSGQLMLTEDEWMKRENNEGNYFSLGKSGLRERLRRTVVRVAIKECVTRVKYDALTARTTTILQPSAVSPNGRKSKDQK